VRNILHILSYQYKNESGSEKLSRTRTNYLIDLILTTLFFSVVGTGLFMYFFMPSGIPRGGQLVYIGLTKATWIWIHSRAGILMATLTVVHLILHWKWIVCTTKNFFGKGKKNLVCEGSKITDEIQQETCKSKIDKK
jgi:hypothetical protein